MEIFWYWVTAQEPHRCHICKETIPAKHKCWMLKEYIEFLDRWKNTFTCQKCEWAVPKHLRQTPPTEAQLSLL